MTIQKLRENFQELELLYTAASRLNEDLVNFKKYTTSLETFASNVQKIVVESPKSQTASHRPSISQLCSQLCFQIFEENPLGNLLKRALHRDTFHAISLTPHTAYSLSPQTNGLASHTQRSMESLADRVQSLSQPLSQNTDQETFEKIQIFYDALYNFSCSWLRDFERAKECSIKPFEKVLTSFQDGKSNGWGAFIESLYLLGENLDLHEEGKKRPSSKVLSPQLEMTKNPLNGFFQQAVDQAIARLIQALKNANLDKNALSASALAEIKSSLTELFELINLLDPFPESEACCRYSFLPDLLDQYKGERIDFAKLSYLITSLSIIQELEKGMLKLPEETAHRKKICQVKEIYSSLSPSERSSLQDPGFLLATKKKSLQKTKVNEFLGIISQLNGIERIKPSQGKMKHLITLSASLILGKR